MPQYQEKKMFVFLCAVRDGYRDNPYHNFQHGVDVTQTLFVMLRTFDGCALVGNEQEQKRNIMCLLVAGLMHDIDHPGLNNTYQINSASELALLYNDKSVLENHHASFSFKKILEKQETNIFSNFSQMTFRNIIRPQICDLILSTDMKRHFDLLKDFHGLIEKTNAVKKNGDSQVKPYNLDDPLSPIYSVGSEEKDKLTHSHSLSPTALSRRQEKKTAEGTAGPKLMELSEEESKMVARYLLHTADISNPAKEWCTAKKWGDLIEEEILTQGDQEKEEGLPVSPGCDRNNFDSPQFSLDFADFIIAPQFLNLREVFPLAQVCLDCLIKNRSQWNDDLLKNSIAKIEDPKKRAEEVDKWKKREMTFHAKYFPVKNDDHPNQTPNQMMQDFVLANTPKIKTRELASTTKRGSFTLILPGTNKSPH